MKRIKFEFIVAILRIGLGLIFIFSCIHKISNPKSFLLFVENYRVIPNWMAEFVAVFLPWFELVAGLCLVTGNYVQGGSIIIGLMSFSFAYGIGLNLFKGRIIDCGCFGLSSKEEMINWWSFIRAIIMIGIAFLIYREDRILFRINLRKTLR